MYFYEAQDINYIRETWSISVEVSRLISDLLSNQRCFRSKIMFNLLTWKLRKNVESVVFWWGSIYFLKVVFHIFFSVLLHDSHLIVNFLWNFCCSYLTVRPFLPFHQLCLNCAVIIFFYKWVLFWRS